MWLEYHDLRQGGPGYTVKNAIWEKNDYNLVGMYGITRNTLYFYSYL